MVESNFSIPSRAIFARRGEMSNNRVGLLPTPSSGSDKRTRLPAFSLQRTERKSFPLLRSGASLPFQVSAKKLHKGCLLSWGKEFSSSFTPFFKISPIKVRIFVKTGHPIAFNFGIREEYISFRPRHRITSADIRLDILIFTIRVANQSYNK